MIRDADPSSDFYFCIRENTSQNRNNYPFTITAQPSGKHTTKSSSSSKQINQISEAFSNWIEIVEEYNNLRTVFDDPILKGYQNELYEDYIILDDDAGNRPFEIEKQLILDKYLEWSIKKLEAYKDEENTTRIEIIQEETQELRKNISGLTKSAVMKRLSKIWAKCAKEGVDLVKQIYLEGKKKFVKFVLEGGIDTLSGFLD